MKGGAFWATKLGGSPRQRMYRGLLITFGVLVIVFLGLYLIKHRISADVVNSARPKMLPIGEKTYHKGEDLALPVYVLDDDEQDMSKVQVLINWGDGSPVTDQANWHRSVTSSWTGSNTMRILAPHRYNAKGSFVLSITAIDSTGTASTVQSIPVRVVGEDDTGSVNYPPSTFQVTDADLANVGVAFPFYINTIDFSDTNGNQTVKIDWGDGTQESKVTPKTAAPDHRETTFNKTYSKAGVYTAVATVTDGAGAETSDKYLIIATDKTWKAAINVSNLDQVPLPKSIQPLIKVTDYDGDATTNTIDWGDGSAKQTLTADMSLGNDQNNIKGNVLNPEAGVYQFKAAYFYAKPSHTYAKDGTYTITVTSTDAHNNVATQPTVINIGTVASTTDIITPGLGTPIKRNTTAAFTFQANDLADSEYASLGVNYPSAITAGAMDEPALTLLPDNQQPAGFDRTKLKLKISSFQGVNYIRKILVPKGMPVSFSTDVSFKSRLDGGVSEFKEVKVLVEKGTPTTDTSGSSTINNPRETRFYSYPISDSDNRHLIPVSGTILNHSQEATFTYDTLDAKDWTLFTFRMWSPKWDQNADTHYQPVSLELLPTSEQPTNFDPSKISAQTMGVSLGPTCSNKTYTFNQGFRAAPGVSFKFTAKLVPLSAFDLWGGRVMNDFSRLDVDIFEKAGSQGKLIEINRYPIISLPSAPLPFPAVCGSSSSGSSSSSAGSTGATSTAASTTGSSATTAPSTTDQTPPATTTVSGTDNGNNAAATVSQVRVNNALNRRTAARVSLVNAKNNLEKAQNENRDERQINVSENQVKAAEAEYDTANRELAQARKDAVIASTGSTDSTGFLATVRELIINFWMTVIGFLGL